MFLNIGEEGKEHIDIAEIAKIRYIFCLIDS